MGARLIVGCGYLGTRLACRWRDQGHVVHATTRGRAEELRAMGLVPIVADVTDRAILPPLPAVETVVHCVGWDRAAGRTMRQVYVEGLANLLDVLPPPGRFVFVSSVSVYGQTGGEEVEEPSATEPLEENGRIVLEAEQLLRARLPGAIILRFAGIYGPGRLIRSEALKAGQPLSGDPERWLNLIHVDDGVGAVEAAIERGQPGSVYNVSDGHPVTRGEFFTTLARLIGAPAPRFEPSGQERGGHRRISNRRLREELGFEPQFRGCERGLVASLS